MSDSSDNEIFVPVKQSWKRKRIDSEDYTSDDNKHKYVMSFCVMCSSNKNLDIHEMIELFVKTERDNNSSKWLETEVKRIVASARNPEAIRVSKVCSELRTLIEVVEDDDDEEEVEDEDDDDEEEVEDEDDDDDDDDDDEDEDEDEGFILDDPNSLFLQLLMSAVNKDNADTNVDVDVEHAPGRNNKKFKHLINSLNNTTENETHTMKFFDNLGDDKQKYYIGLLDDMKTRTQTTDDIPYLMRLMDVNIDDVTKQTIIDHISVFNKMSPQTSEYGKKRNLIKAIQTLPFGKMAKTPASLDNAMVSNIAANKYLTDVKISMDKVIYGHSETKNQTLRLIASMISNGSAKGGNCFALSGPPGVGKTEITQEIAKALGRPCVKINLGGSSNGDDLVGHGYTYEGSTYGLIARAMMDARCENPVIIMDELDKISETTKGREIVNILIHMTDSTQNSTFSDKYLAGISIDLSKVTMVFTMNDPSYVSPILLDRMKIIHVDGYKVSDKVIIAQKYIVDTVKTDMGYKYNHSFDDVAIRDIINQYTFEGGVRKLKELITDVFMEINLRKMMGKDVDGKPVPDVLIITKDMLRNDIFKDKHHIHHVMVSDTDQVGLVNGLWANSYGIGGLIPIEAHTIPTPCKFDLQLTGMQGDVMKESMMVAKTVAWRLTPNKTRRKIQKDWLDNGSSGIHIHCPDGSTPKDGPSAGGAITLCLYSRLNNSKIKQSIAMTGEINLQGKITEIGGLEEKIFGAITAGVKTILYPFENQRDLDKIKKKFPYIFDQSSKSYINMIPVTCIEEILKNALE
uniref:Lon proteolytic domain-containing protein n=1 Tax=viral metagenome TaxID=1070528 RepID=A0A6C0LV21_9ZZZZ